MYVKGNSVHDVRIQEYLEADQFRRDNIGCSQSRPSKQERLKELRVKYPKQRALTKAEKMLLDEMGIEFHVWRRRAGSILGGEVRSSRPELGTGSWREV